MQTAEVNCLKRLCARDFKSSSSYFSQRSCGFQLISVCVCVCLRSRISNRDSGNSISAFFVLIRSVLTGLKQQLQSQLFGFFRSTGQALLDSNRVLMTDMAAVLWHVDIGMSEILSSRISHRKCRQIFPVATQRPYIYIYLLDRSDCKLSIIICLSMIYLHKTQAAFRELQFIWHVRDV